MKIKILCIIPFILLITSCHEQPFQLDDIILECYDSKYQQEDFDIKTIIDDYEKLLVKNGILKDDSGKSYLEVYQKITTDKNFRIASATFREYDPWNKVDKKVVVVLFECEGQMIELAKKQDSKWINLFEKFESTQTKENPSILYHVMTENLSENDLNSYYFKLKMFHLFDMVNEEWNKQSLTVPASVE